MLRSTSFNHKFSISNFLEFNSIIDLKLGHASYLTYFLYFDFFTLPHI